MRYGPRLRLLQSELHEVYAVRLTSYGRVRHHHKARRNGAQRLDDLKSLRPRVIHALGSGFSVVVSGIESSYESTLLDAVAWSGHHRHTGSCLRNSWPIDLESLWNP